MLKSEGEPGWMGKVMAQVICQYLNNCYVFNFHDKNKANKQTNIDMRDWTSDRSWSCIGNVSVSAVFLKPKTQPKSVVVPKRFVLHIIYLHRQSCSYRARQKNQTMLKNYQERLEPLMTHTLVSISRHCRYFPSCTALCFSLVCLMRYIILSYLNAFAVSGSLSVLL